MIWRDDELKNPLSGAALKYDSLHSLTDGARRFPVISDIPYLRVGRDELCAAALKKLDAGDEPGALTALFQDQDEWAKTAPPTESDLQPIFDEKIDLRGAMNHLKYGAVADYFAYRWSDPTFLSGLCLLENHLPPHTKEVCELACGIGHFLREFAARNITATGADVVFSKLWLARKFVAPDAKLVCFDANYDFPFAENAFDAAFCHDAFYFLPQKSHVASELKRTTDGAILIGHAHNADAENYSSGAAMTIAEYAAMFENPTLYDDAELTKACLEDRPPNAQTVEALKNTEAVAVVSGASDAPNAFNFFLPTSEVLRVNPLLIDENNEITNAPKYPSERYENEYAPLSGYLNLSVEEIEFVRENSSIQKLKSDEKLKDLVRRRIFLDLPKNWQQS